MIKQIKLRGISRTPSDKTTADGGCVESLNVQVDDDEIAPALSPKRVLPQGLGYRVIYLHKTADGDKYLAVNDEGDLAVIDGLVTEEIAAGVINTEVSNVSNIGNTVVINVQGGPSAYVLYKDGRYKYIGTNIPEPVIEFLPTYEDVAGVERRAFVNISSIYDPALLNGVISNHDTTHEAYSLINEIKEKLWSKANELAQDSLNSGYFPYPFLVRYALRLYDGTYIHVSAPVYMGAGFKKTFEARITTEQSGGAGQNTIYSGKVIQNLKFKVKAQLRNWSAGNWGDYISSIDIFMSPYLPYPNMDANIKSFSVRSGDYDVVFEGKETDIKDNIKGVAQFTKIASFNTANLSDLTTGYDLSTEWGIMSQESRIASGDDLASDYSPSFFADNSTNYNSRLVLSGVTEVLPYGYRGYFAPAKGDGQSFTPTSFKIVYYISGEDGKTHTVKGRGVNGWQIDGEPDAHGKPHGVIFYPHPGCFRADIYWDGSVAVIPMEPMTYMNASVGYVGVDVSLEHFSMVPDDEQNDYSRIEVDHLIKIPGKVMLTQPNNMFAIDVGSTCYFQGEVVGMAAATRALSDGQIGQFPWIVFTDEGISYVSVDSSGGFATAHALSREIAIPGTVTPIDQAIVFGTRKGVMLLQGSDVTELSAAIRGGGQLLDSIDIASVVSQYEWPEDIVGNNTPIEKFISGGGIAYDYKGARLFLYNKDYDFMYVYKFGSASWHKIVRAYAGDISRINSYPSCQFCESDGLSYHVMDYSVVPADVQESDGEVTALPGIVLTRTLDFNAPGVRKAIRSIRIKGRFQPGHVKYVLYGSMDGLQWTRLHSLRGGSYKYLKLALLTNLAYNERVSWVDIDYETRFLNKLR